jgi:2-haloacid dehalogenase
MKVIAFDVFGTVVSLMGVTKNEIWSYLDHIREPLRLPESWEKLLAFPDSKEGLELLRQSYYVVTCSNAPLGTLTKLSKYNGLNWDAIIPLELNKVYKPHHRAYLTVCEVMGVSTSEVMMVTANEKFGDLETSELIGMKPVLIRGEEIPTIIDLAHHLGIK